MTEGRNIRGRPSGISSQPVLKSHALHDLLGIDPEEPHPFSRSLRDLEDLLGSTIDNKATFTREPDQVNLTKAVNFFCRQPEWFKILCQQMVTELGDDVMRSLLRECIPKPQTTDRLHTACFLAAYRSLRLDLCVKRYMGLYAKASFRGGQQAADLSRAVDKIILAAYNSGCETEREAQRFFMYILAKIRIVTSARFGGNYGGRGSVAKYEDYAIACLSHFRRMLYEHGLRDRADYEELVAKLEET